MTTTTLYAPYRTKKRIELEAQLLLESFAKSRDPIDEPPIPIEQILEFHLGLGLSICNLREALGFEDAVGALCVENREVMVDERLDPERYPEFEGRFRFTLAHEVGHWQLHRHIYYHLRANEEAPIASRLCDAHRRIERQADYFAACLLMPRLFVFRWWRSVWGSRVISLDQLQARRQEFIDDEIVRRRFVPATPAEEDNMIFDRMSLPIAEHFRVSPMAMRIRLEELQLLVR